MENNEVGDHRNQIIIEEYNGSPVQKILIGSTDGPLNENKQLTKDSVLKFSCLSTAIIQSQKRGIFSKNYDLSTKKKSISEFLDYFRITFLASVFLPQGFPNTVSPDYLNYQLWDTIQAFASSQSGALATLATLKGVGVGNEAASVLAASLTWLIKDGTGMISRILFAWAKSNILDSDCKRSLGSVLPLCIIFVLRLLFLCDSFNRWCGWGYNSARRDNLADVAAKDGSQETLVNVLSLLVSLWLLPLVDGRPLLTWSLFAVFTFVHLFANYRAVRSLQLDTLNQARFRIAIRHFIETGEAPSIIYCNSQEPIVRFHNFRRHFGCQLSSIPKLPISIFGRLESEAEGEFRFADAQNDNFGWLTLDTRASEEDKFSAFFSLEYFSFTGRWPNTMLKTEETAFRDKMLQKGWVLHTNQLNFDEWRFNLKA